MKVSRIGTLVLVLVCISCFPLLPGCSATPGTSGSSDTNGTGADETLGADGSADDASQQLTDSELGAIAAAGKAPGATASAVDVVKNSAGDLDDNLSETEQPGQTLPEVTFGTCPEVAKTGSLGDAGVELSIDFGEEPCTALAVEEDFTLVCSGDATGRFGVADRGISLQFNSIRCNDQQLDGNVDLTYALLNPGIGLEGDWDLTWMPGDQPIGTEGAGIVSYLPASGGCCDITSIATFEGTVTEDGQEWSIVMTDILISLEEYLSFTPYNGSIAIDGPDIRALTITFTQDSPSSGEVSVSIENGRSFTLDLYELEQWGDLVLGDSSAAARIQPAGQPCAAE